MLQQSLEAMFLEGVRTGDTARLTQCLRTYALIDRARDDEVLFRQATVAPFVAKVGREGARSPPSLRSSTR